MARRLIIERLDRGAAAPSEDLGRVDAPTISAIRLVFGVGRRPGQAPTREDFSPTYTVEIPVFSLSGLDSDGVHEFDAVRTLEDLQVRAERRAWAMRLELSVVQDAATVNAAEIYVDTPFADGDDAPELFVAGHGDVTTLGGARELILASSLAHDGEAVAALGGEFTVQLRDADPRTEASASVESATRRLVLNLTRYEFQG